MDVRDKLPEQYRSNMDNDTLNFLSQYDHMELVNNVVSSFNQAKSDNKLSSADQQDINQKLGQVLENAKGLPSGELGSNDQSQGSS
jgi:hypothetical protein